MCPMPWLYKIFLRLQKSRDGTERALGTSAAVLQLVA